MSPIRGETAGLKKSDLADLEKLYRRRLERDQVLSYDLAELLCEKSLHLKRPITLLFDRRGRVEEVILGDTATLEQLPGFAPPSSESGLCEQYCVQTKLGWQEPDRGSKVTLLQYHFPLIVLLTAGTTEGFSQKYGEHPHFCDGAYLLAPGLERSGRQLAIEIRAPMTARALSEESLQKWVEWGEATFAQRPVKKTAHRERALLIGVHEPGGEGQRRLQHTIAELYQLAETAGAEVLGEIQQSRNKPDPNTYLGSGKADELSLLIQELQADVVIADDTLTPVQQRTLEQVLRVKVIDRTEVILDIFAQRARSREGQIQVELAQLQYLLPRLVGRGRMFSQQTAVGAKGGIATRGPGETKLETDRRILHQRISRLEQEAEEVTKHRAFQRQRREQFSQPTLALVGYTNAGKSTLMRALTGANILVENKLFATLDPTTRRLYLPSGREVLLSDTVGFIQKLPTFLVKAFRATLEEALSADLLLHVWDMSHPDALQHLTTVQETLEQLGAGDRPILTLCNKIDQVPDWEREFKALSPMLDCALPLSATQGEGVPALLAALDQFCETKVLEGLGSQVFYPRN